MRKADCCCDEIPIICVEVFERNRSDPLPAGIEMYNGMQQPAAAFTMPNSNRIIYALSQTRVNRWATIGITVCSSSRKKETSYIPRTYLRNNLV